MISKKLLCLALLIVSVAAEVPSYIHVCGRRNPKFDECVLESVSALTEKLRVGIPELDIPGVEPLTIDRLPFANMPNFKAVATDVVLTGLSNYKVNSLHVDLEKQMFDIDVNFHKCNLNAIYDITARILVPVAGKGKVHLTTNDLNAKVRMVYKLVDRGGKKYVFFPSMTTRLNIKDYDSEFDVPEGADSPLRQAINQVVGTNHEEIIEAVRPNLEKAISEWVLQFSNRVCKHFSYDELLPDRE